VAIPCQSVNRIIITPVGHPLLKIKRPTLQQLAAYPLIAYDRKLSGGWKVLQAFEARGLQPNLALTAIDAEVIKTYVEAGMGVAVVQAPVYQRGRDRGLRAIEAAHLFAPAVTVLMLKPRVYVREVVHDFIGTVMPGAIEARVREAMTGR
jgi:LysR family cys regulon transcriptional activator